MKSVKEILSNFPPAGSWFLERDTKAADIQVTLVSETSLESNKQVLCLPPLTALDPDTVKTRKRRRE